MRSFNEEGYQVATLVVVVVTVLVCMFYFLIFINPQIALNPLKPPVAPATGVAFALSPTWTRTPTNTPTATFTPTSTPTITPTPTQTNTPTNTRPAPTRTPTRRPAPTSTPRPPTPVPSIYPYRAVRQGCTHSGGTFIKGTVWSGVSPQSGVLVRAATSPNGVNVVGENTTAVQPDGSTTYTIVLRQNGSFGNATWFVYAADGAGNPISDPNYSVQTNNLGPDNPGACWFLIVDFAR